MIQRSLVRSDRIYKTLRDHIAVYRRVVLIKLETVCAFVVPGMITGLR
jgi:hypothetical protein